MLKQKFIKSSEVTEKVVYDYHILLSIEYLESI